MRITVYTLPNCVQCRATTRWLDERKIPHATIDLSQDAAAEEAVRSRGYAQAPVVHVTRPDGTVGHWGGFNPTLLAALEEPA